MKKFLDSIDGWIGFVSVMAIIVALTVGLVVEHISHSITQIKLHGEALQIIELNQKLVGENIQLRRNATTADIVIQRQHEILKLMYERLQEYEDLPPFVPEPEQKNQQKRRQRSEA